MNLFRRSSTGEDVNNEAGTLKNSFCRVFLPRSRTTSSCNLGSATASQQPQNQQSTGCLLSFVRTKLAKFR